MTNSASPELRPGPKHNGFRKAGRVVLGRLLGPNFGPEPARRIRSVDHPDSTPYVIPQPLSAQRHLRVVKDTDPSQQ